MLAAQAANMKCIGLKSEVEDKYPADIVVSSLDQITIELIKSL
jgi:phosphoglycolate phosphatase-like HAD superfamily hydrolase